MPFEHGYSKRVMKLTDVFAFSVKVNSPDGPVPPLVTGTFAGADFCFSMLGEASDKISSASIADLTSQLDGAQDANKKPSGSLDVNHDLASMDEKKHAFDLDVGAILNPDQTVH